MTKIDATNQSLGRLASRVALVLRGKLDPKFQPHILPDKPVAVFNTDKVKLTGKKIEQKKYYRHTGYPGGIKETGLKELMKRDSRLVIRKAVFGMLPKNRLRSRIIKNLKLYKGEIS